MCVRDLLYNKKNWTRPRGCVCVVRASLLRSPVDEIVSACEVVVNTDELKERNEFLGHNPYQFSKTADYSLDSANEMFGRF